MSAVYAIEDEPKPGALAQWVVGPIWPLFAIMFAGLWLALPWFVFNAFALGSSTRWREAAVAIAGLVGNAVLVLALILAVGEEAVPQGALKYLGVGLSVWKLGCAYWLYSLQSRSFGLFEYYGGVARKGLIPIVLGVFLKSKLFAAAPAILPLLLG